LKFNPSKCSIPRRQRHETGTHQISVKVILIAIAKSTNCSTTTKKIFAKIFKVRVEFGRRDGHETIPSSPNTPDVCAHSLKKELLWPFDRGAFAAILEYGVRMAGRRNKVTARFVDIADLAREANYAATEAGETVVRAAHVRTALSSKVERHNLIETRIREMIQDGTLLVDVAGKTIGQVNGLSVLEIGGYAFGKPVRITATAAPVKPASSISNASRT